LVSHSFCICWTGAALAFLVSIRPSLGKLSPQASGEFVLKVMPRFVRSVRVFTVFTLAFGPLLALMMNDGPPNQFNLVSPWSVFRNYWCFHWNYDVFCSFLPFHPDGEECGTHNKANAAKSPTASASRV
jgi:hypothetical protein